MENLSNLIGERRQKTFRYPHARYGQRFYVWLAQKDFKPYNSFGNGSASQFTIPYDRQQLADYLCVERSALSAEKRKQDW